MRETLALYARRRVDALMSETDIIASSPWVQGNGDLPHRIVMRDLGAVWVVHTQCINVVGGSVSYCWGHYEPKSGDPRGFAMLWATFEERCRTHLGLKDRE
jgi:hypothetical protein